jgi:uncharacterized protein (DUF927 family)
LSVDQYEKKRIPTADHLGIRVTMLDMMVKAAARKLAEDQHDAIEACDGPPRDASSEEVIEWLADLPAVDRKKDLFTAAKCRLGITVKEIRDAVTDAIKAHDKAEEERRRAARVQQRTGFTIITGGALSLGAKPERKPDADGVIWPPGFTMKDTGLWYEPPPTDKVPEPDPILVCAPFKVVAQTSDETDHEHGLLLHWDSRTKQKHVWAMPQRMVHLEGNPIAVELQGAGLTCGTSRTSHEQLKNFFGAVSSTKQARCVDRSGWHGNAFVLPNGRVFGADENSVVLQSEYTLRGEVFTARGKLEEWQEHIAKPAIGNSRLVFALSTSFTPPLYDVTGETSGGVHNHGGSQIGKTTGTCVLASVWGRGDTRSGQIRSWRATSNGMEAVAAQYNDLPLPLEEISQAEARELGPIVYMFGNQRGKSRMSRSGGAQRDKIFRTGIYSTGEVTLAVKMEEAGLKAHAGQEVRLLNVPADGGAGLGVFEDLHGAASAGEFADQLRRDAVTYYGSAGPAFLEELVEARTNDAEKLKRVLRGMCEQFLTENLPKDADGQVRSAALRFALIAAAGELARAYDVVPWPEGEATKAAAACFKAWLAARGGAGPAEDAQIIEVLKGLIAHDGASRFESLDRKQDEPRQDPNAAYPGSIGGHADGQPSEQRIIDRAGYKRTVGDGQEFLIFPTVWRRTFKGMDPERAGHVARDAGFLQTLKSSRHLTKPVRIPGFSKRVRFYVVSDAILAGEDE